MSQHDLDHIMTYTVYRMSIQWKEIENATIYMFVDVTHIRKAEEEKSRAEMTQMMIQNSSHELKTPLNAIIANSELAE